MRKELKDFMQAYAAAFDKLDVETQAELFSDVFLSAGPKGVIAQSKRDFKAKAHEAGEMYRRLGQNSARILTMNEHQVSEGYSLVKVHWGVTFAKTGSKLIEFDVSYLVDLTGPEPRILLFIAHQDEDEAMRELGLKPDAARA